MVVGWAELGWAQATSTGAPLHHLHIARAASATAAALLAVSLLAVPASAATPTIPDESFAGVSTPSGDWLYGGVNWTPCLTAASTSAPGSIPSCPGAPLDPVGDGALRLTETGSQGGFAILDTPIDTSLGLQIEFDMFQYNSPAPGDGMSFFLIDGSSNPTTAGSYGGGLGYASSYFFGYVPGLVGGYVGVGFDAYGGYSEGNIGDGGGGPGVHTANGIALRGDAASDYTLISSHVAAGPLAVPLATDRDDAVRHVVVTISKLNVMSVAVDYGAGLVTELSGIDLETVNGTGSLPASLKLGFAGSTGGAYDIHEIRNFEIQTLAPNLGVTLSATAVDATTRAAVITASVVNAAATGATDDTITVTSALPAGVVPTSASGTGWACGIAGQTVTCSRSGVGADRLAAGESAPPLNIAVTVSPSTVLPVAVSARVSVLDDSSAANDAASAQLVLAALADTGAESDALGALAVALLLAGVLLFRRPTGLGAV